MQPIGGADLYGYVMLPGNPLMRAVGQGYFHPVQPVAVQARWREMVAAPMERVGWRQIKSAQVAPGTRERNFYHQMVKGGRNACHLGPGARDDSVGKWLLWSRTWETMKHG